MLPLLPIALSFVSQSQKYLIKSGVNNSVQLCIIYVPTQQLQGHLQKDRIVDTINYITVKKKHKGNILKASFPPDSKSMCQIQSQQEYKTNATQVNTGENVSKRKMLNQFTLYNNNSSIPLFKCLPTASGL
jgi:hypothetical protein